MSLDSAIPPDDQAGEQPRLSVDTTAGDAFPDFSDPALFSGRVNVAADVLSVTCSEASTTSPTASSTASPVASNIAGPSSSRFLLPIPTPATNKSQTSFALSEVGEGEGGLESLPPEIASADISISADGSFVETTSGPAARELKRRYDAQHGVSKDVRSPYIITAIINQHGKQVYRVGMRSQAQAQDPTPTPELNPDVPAPSSASLTASQAQRKRRSRLSINGFLKGAGPSQPLRVPSDEPKVSTSSSSTSAFGPRKLRKPRSIPDLTSSASGYFGDAVGAPPTSTGRAHSHSVTGADMPRPIVQTVVEAPRPPGDAFGNVMGWSAAVPPSSPMTSSGLTPSSHSLLTPSTPSEYGALLHSKELIEHPFGRNVSFDSPFRSSAIFLPSIIREMQSFESGRTARASTQPTGSAEETPHRPDSFDSLASTSSATDSDSSPSSAHSGPRAVPAPESYMYTRYPTSVFDVIQNYRGLPMLDTLSAESRQPTIKMSLSALDGAVPRDDPRFVIWGDLDGPGAEQASLADSIADAASSHSRPPSHTQSPVSSRKRSIRGRSHGGGGGAPEVRVSAAPDAEGTDDGDARRVLMAATIERWLAQLTSQFDYDELLIFFLTFRTYIDAADLCHLLICRFHWALEEPLSPQEVMVKQIVRVRTFVAIRYWLLTFFRVDFLPNRELCISFSNWLNTLWRDPILDKYSDARNIVRKLKKVAKDCKDAHSRRSKTSKGPEKKGVMQSIDRILGDLSNGVNFAASLRKVSEAQHEEEDSDVDLDFNPEESSPFSDAVGIQGFTSFANQLGPATDSGDSAGIARPETSQSMSASRPTNSTSRILLQQPLHLTILQHARAMQPGTDRALVEAPGALPVHHSTLSRVVVNTIGRLGRWKRVLSSRSPATPLSPCGDVSAFDLELNATGDLFTVRGGVEQYLKMIDPAAGSPNSPSLPQVTLSIPTTNAEDVSSPITPLSLSSPQETDVANTTPIVKPSELKPDDAAINGDSPRSQTPAGFVHRSISRIRSADRAESLRSYSSGSLRSYASSFGNPVAPGQKLFPDVVSIDDLDYLSDNSSHEDEPARPPGLRPTRRLPLRREFEFVRRSVDSVSSMGIISRESVALSEQVDSSRSSVSSPRGLGGALQQWQVNALIDDLSDDEADPGDAEAALRRLEGQINPQQQRMKEKKVDGWVRTIQERLANGEFRDEQPRNLSDEEDDRGSDEDYGTTSRDRNSFAEDEDITVSLPRSSEESSDRPSLKPLTAEGNAVEEAVTPTPRQTTHPINGSGSQHTPASDAKPKIDEAVPAEILQSRLPSRSSASDTPSLSKSKRNGRSHAPSNFAVPHSISIPVAHRSFILHYRSETLAQHFAVIDREIFLGIKFQELVSAEWMSSTEDLNVLDWMKFLRDRRRKVELRGKGKISVLAAARARFNLVANFVLSEIALTNPHDRVVVVSKFIRIAWKAYTQNNFATLVAIVTGLGSEWVRKAMKRSWARVGIWEMRVYEDLRAFCTSEDDFRYIRKAITAIVDAKPLNAGGQDDAATTSTGPTDGVSSGNKSRANTDGRVVVPSSCVPFIGVYLSQLYRFSRLPDLIDPSAPTESVDIDPDTGNFKAPAHPEVFSDLRPLPPSMQIEPLINVQKQRKIAGVIKSLVAGQHLANKVEVDVDKKLLTRCLKLSALDFESLQRIFAVYSDY